MLILSIIVDIMKHKNVIFPRAQRTLTVLGQNIKLARLRRKLSAAKVAERANISRATVSAIEQGSPSVAMGNYFQVSFVLGLEQDFLQVAKDDVLGRKLQDARLTVAARAPKRQKGSPDEKS